MSDTSLAIAQSFAAMQAASTRQALQTEMVKQQVNAEQALVEMLQQSAEQSQQQAALPAGQGENLDITV
jgi:3-dehydroquinate dehydratase